MSNMKKLLRSIPQVGKVNFISIRSERKTLPTTLEKVNISIEKGLDGDHYQGSSRKRQVTLIQAEHLNVIASILEKNKISIFLKKKLVLKKKFLQNFTCISSCKILKSMRIKISKNSKKMKTTGKHPKRPYFLKKITTFIIEQTKIEIENELIFVTSRFPCLQNDFNNSFRKFENSLVLSVFLRLAALARGAGEGLKMDEKVTTTAALGMQLGSCTR